MLNTADARDAIAAAIRQFDPEIVGLSEANGRVLRQSIRAERDQPPFDRVMMDGIAIGFAEFASGERLFRIASTQHAGDPMHPLGDPAECVEVMTGAVLPVGADTVIPVERLVIADGVAEIERGYRPEPGQFIHARGSDHRASVEVLAPGAAISPMDVAIIASCGLNRVSVARSPTIRVISTGNELVPAGAAIEPHQIRLSNGPALLAMLAQQGFSEGLHDHLIDEPALLAERIQAHLEAADVLILSGGVSMGKADFVPRVLDDLGVEPVFHKIRQRPGKPMWFGVGPDGQAVFALPGNPVSALVCCRQYVLPALLKASGRPDRPIRYAVLDAPVTFAPDLTYFLPVRIRTDLDGRLLAVPCPTNTSGDFTTLSGTDGYVELAAAEREFAAGRSVPFHAWDYP